MIKYINSIKQQTKVSQTFGKIFDVNSLSFPQILELSKTLTKFSYFSFSQQTSLQNPSKKKERYDMYPIEEYQVGQRLDRYLKNNNVGWVAAQRYLRTKDIYVVKADGLKVKCNQHDYRLSSGDKMFVKKELVRILHPQKPSSTSMIDFNYAKDILDKITIFDNRNITIVNKPPQYSVQGGEDVMKNIFSLMAARYKKQFVHITHRLDKPTTGVLMFAKNLTTAQLVQGAIQKRTDFSKFYIALTAGPNIQKTQDYIRCDIQWTKKQKARITKSLQSQESKDCITYYNKIHSQELNSQGQAMSLLGLKLITGRKHQIRCHLTDWLQSPILNDRRYGGVMLVDQQQKIVQNTQTKDIVKKDELKQDQEGGTIFLHALMTTIQNKQIIQKVFEIENIDSLKMLSDNDNGLIIVQKGKLKILAKMPEHWKKLKHIYKKFQSFLTKQMSQNQLSSCKNVKSIFGERDSLTETSSVQTEAKQIKIQKSFFIRRTTKRSLYKTTVSNE